MPETALHRERRTWSVEGMSEGTPHLGGIVRVNELKDVLVS